MYNDIQSIVGNGFDAVLCLGNSFAHMLDSFGDQREQKRAIQNFKDCVKPGGLLLIDHRNYDNIMNTGSTPSKCIYYNVSSIIFHVARNLSLCCKSLEIILRICTTTLVHLLQRFTKIVNLTISGYEELTFRSNKTDKIIVLRVKGEGK